jgi:S1-C subfamily serine protease
MRIPIALLVMALVGTACQSQNAAQTSPTSLPATATTSGVAASATRPTNVASPVVGAAPSQTVAASASASTAPSPSVVAAASPAPGASGATTAQLSNAVRQVSDRVKPAVVQITNEQVQLDRFNDPFTVPAGVGSGAIYDASGHILTNNHVVEGAQRLLVSLPDGRSFDANVVGRDPQTDLAVLQISGDNLPVVELGNSRGLRVGDWVVAIGNALGLPGGPTVTAGVVSALGRTVQEPSGPSGQGGGGLGQPQAQAQPQAAGPFLFDVIQTDAAINPGNSGGPLLDLQGRLVGINTLVAGQAEPGVQAQGIGFSIAIDTAKPIADQLVAAGRIAHPFLGIQYVPINPAIARQLGVQVKNGVVVGAVQPGSPAAAAGVQPRDVITQIDGQDLQGDSSLAESVNAHKPGDSITLTVLRENQQVSLPVTLGQLSGPTS